MLSGNMAASPKQFSPGSGAKSVDVDEPGDLAGAGVDVGDHGAPVGVGDEHDRLLDAADEVADGSGVGGEPAKGVGGSDVVAALSHAAIDNAIPARRLGERAVDENDLGVHPTVLSVGITCAEGVEDVSSTVALRVARRVRAGH
jgi:hypothetical protein